MKSLTYLGDPLKRLRAQPADVRHDFGYQLAEVQNGRQPADFKPMATVGADVEDIWRTVRKLRSDLSWKVGAIFERSWRSEDRRSQKSALSVAKFGAFASLRTVCRGFEKTGTYRAIYLARLADVVSVLHALQKKSQATPLCEIAVAKFRYADLMKDRE